MIPLNNMGGDKDAQHEIRTYRGWDASSHTNTGPIEVVREYRPETDADTGQQTVYFETLSSSATPGMNGSSNLPDGSETISSGNIQSLTRTLTNDAGQVSQVCSEDGHGGPGRRRRGGFVPRRGKPRPRPRSPPSTYAIRSWVVKEPALPPRAIRARQ